MSEGKHRELWKKLAHEAGEDEIDRAASVTVEQAEAELRAAGFDVAAERARANAFLDALESGAPRGSTAGMARQATSRAARGSDETRRARRRPAVAWLAAAATLGGTAGAALVAALSAQPAVEMTRSPEPPSASVPVVAPAAHLGAADLRRRAIAACGAKQWGRCLADLDKARAADPGADDAPQVRSLRDQAIEGIEQP